MYKLGYRVYSGWQHKKVLYLSVLAAALIIVLGLWYFRQQDKLVVINPTAPVVTNVKTPSAPTHIFSEQFFSVTLPSSWQLTDHQSSPFNEYIFKDTTKYEDARYLDIYVDTIPTTYAVNKLLPVTVSNNQISLGALSDVCSNFTGPASPNPNEPVSALSQKSKWEGIDFICDLNNPDRNVVGTSSLAGINKFVLTGKATGQHSFFFVYTDHTAEPEYQTLMSALISLQPK